MAQMAEKFLLSRLSRAGFLILLPIAVFAVVQNEPLTAIAAIVGAGLVFTSNAFHPGRIRQPWPSIHRLLFGALLLLLVTSLWTGPWSLIHWLYVAPLIGFALLPLAWATAITLLVAALAVVATQGHGGIPERHQMVSALLLTIMLSGLLVFLREYKSRQLAPLRRTDELTQAASREYLSADLHKEIQRSEREGTDMSLIMIGLDTHLSDRNADADIRSILPRIGRYLHSQLRDFDTYYRVADLQFLIILPGIATTDAAALAETIRKGLSALLASHQLDLTVSAGIAGLNIGDDADSLQQSAANALRRAQQQGGNRAQSYSTWSHTTPPARTEGTGGPA
ncbi:GGDEF domain-containing protein [Marinobacter orientalis]|uniref:GGDEF domain-containing protein n=1 Tax=Marinobacter orientalis TaxID=1928859 RepID=A0A7Y0RD72_9GAMM|nr:GGDEF domain-containing protein [Marinobacter orientalis]NMT64063.1 GGDEF domain-containing protein [Marinobacter orientalis]TGX49297.1 GGDEF domain-containing protein [Marinobacter orientalis]